MANDDPMSRDRMSEVFGEIISHLEDPEKVRGRRILGALCASFFTVGAIAVVVSGLGWLGLVAFASTFVPVAVLGLSVHDRTFVPPRTGLRPEEEQAFSALASRLGGSGAFRPPRPLVMVSAAMVGLGATCAVLLGVPGEFVTAFVASSGVGLSAGLAALAASDKRRRGR